MQQKPQPAIDRTAFGGTVPRVLLAVLVLCVLPELVLFGADRGFWGTTQWRIIAYANGGFWTGLLGDWRSNYAAQPVLMFATYGFLHAGLAHLVVNMITLLSLGPPVVARIGPARFLILYAASLIGGAIGFAALSNVVAPMVGASGALFGLIGAIIAWDYADRRTAAMQLWPVLRSVLLLVLLNLVMWWAMDGLLAWQTHLGGFVAGALFAWLLGRPGNNPADNAKLGL